MDNWIARLSICVSPKFSRIGEWSFASQSPQSAPRATLRDRYIATEVYASPSGFFKMGKWLRRARPSPLSPTVRLTTSQVQTYCYPLRSPAKPPTRIIPQALGGGAGCSSGRCCAPDPRTRCACARRSGNCPTGNWSAWMNFAFARRASSCTGARRR